MFETSKLKKIGLIFAWSLYDLANQFFALNVVSLYFVRWVTIERNTPEIFYSLSYGISTFLVAILGPLLGAISDVSGRRRPFLIYLTLLSILFTTALGGVNNLLVALICFAVANFGCQTAIIFYNAMMINVAPAGKIGLVSGLGKMFGYCGAILGIYLVRPLVLKSGYQAAFLPTAMLFLVFSIPCFVFIKDKSRARINLLPFLNKQGITNVFRALKVTAFNTKEFPGLLNYLKATFFGLCVVNAVILFMSVYATRVFGLDELEISNLLIFSTLFAVGGSFISGFLSDFVGYKRSVGIVFILWFISLILGSFITQKSIFWFVGALVGMTLGSTWVVLRAMAIKLVPPEKMGEVFGLFNLVGYFAGIVGSLFWGAALLIFSLFDLKEYAYRLTLFSLCIFLAFALIFIRRLPEIEVKRH